MKKICLLLIILLFSFPIVGEAAEKESKAQITFENEYIPQKIQNSGKSEKEESKSQPVNSGSQQESSSKKRNQFFERLPQTNEATSFLYIFGLLLIGIVLIRVIRKRRRL